jgi:hypothetical protein
MIETIDPCPHPPVSKDMVEQFVILCDQLGQSDIFKFLLWNFSMYPFIVSCTGYVQLLTHPGNAPVFFFMKISDSEIL